MPVEVQLDGRDPDVVADALFALGASAVLERSASVVADLDASVLAEAGVGHLGSVRILEQPGPVAAVVDERRVGRRLLLTPRASGQHPGRVEVILEAAGAFGSGSHPSTRLCLAALERVVPPGGSVLDVGCGTGVLGAAALLLGAGSLTAIDVDREALRVTRRVLDRNRVAERAVVLDPVAPQPPLAHVEGTFDLILANLLVPTIESLGEQLVARVAAGGALVVGGVLVRQRDRAVAALAPLVPTVGFVEGSWWSGVLRRPTHEAGDDGERL